MPLFATLVDAFDGTGPAGEWTDNGAALVGGGVHVNAFQNAGAAVYSSRRSRAAYTFASSQVVIAAEGMPGIAGDAANAQVWVQDSAPDATVARLGWEYRAAANALDCVGQQGASYASIGVTTSLTYNPVAHRYLRLRHTGTSIVWDTSPDGLTWTVRRTLTTLPTWTAKTTLLLGLEAYRTTGTNDAFRVGSVNVLPAALATVLPTGTDALQRRTLNEVRTWKQWLTTYGATGFVGEFNGVTLFRRYGDAAQGAQWDALLDSYLTELDVQAISGTVWASGREWGAGYPLGVHVGTNANDPLSIANAGAAGVIAAHPTRSGRWRGVNLAGHETGINIAGGGTVRSAPPLLHTGPDFAFLAGQGVDTVRLPLAWERLQPTLSGALDTTAMAALDAMLSAARQHGIRVIADLHNYGRYTLASGQVAVLGSGLTNAQFSDFWTRFVGWLAGNASRSGVVVGLGLMNEVHTLAGGAATWETASQAALTAIRNAGDTRLVLVGGYQFSSLTSWASNHTRNWITDPSANFMFEAHHYWDTKSALGSRSGTYQQSSTGPILTYQQELDAASAAETKVPAVRETLTSTGLGGAGTSPTVATSAATAVGDVLVAIHALDYGSLDNLPSPTPGTWALRATGADNATDGVGHMRVWTRRVTTAGSQSVVCPTSDQTDNVLTLVVLDGSTLPTDDSWFAGAAGGSSTATTISHLTPSVATGAVNDLLIGAVAAYTPNAAATTYTAPAGTTKLGTDVTSRNYVTQSVFAETRAIAGPTGTRSATSSSSQAYSSAALVVHGGSQRTMAYVDLPAVTVRASVAGDAELIKTGRTIDLPPVTVRVGLVAPVLERGIDLPAVSARNTLQRAGFERGVDLSPAEVTVSFRDMLVDNLSVAPTRVRVGVLDLEVTFQSVTPLTEHRPRVYVRPRKRLRFLAQRVLDRQWLSWDLALRQPKIGWKLTGASEIAGVIAARELRDIGLDEWSCFIHAELDGRIRASAMLMPFSFGGPNIEIVASGITRYLHGTPYQGDFTLRGDSGVVGQQLDPLDIVRHVWAHAQSYPDGRLGVVLSPTRSGVRIGTPDTSATTATPADVPAGGMTGADTVAATGTPPSASGATEQTGGPYILKWWEDSDLGKVVDDLAAQSPFDYREMPYWNDDKTDVIQYVELGYPRLGRVRDDLSFTEGQNLTSALTPVEDDDNFATEVVVLGKGEGTARIRGRFGVRVRNRVRRVVIVEKKDITTTAMADAYARSEWSRRQGFISFDEIDLKADHPNAALGSFSVGDDIPARAKVDGLGQVTIRHRVTGLTYDVNASKLVAATKRSDTYTYGPPGRTT